MTIAHDSAELKSLVIHQVGNKNNDEALAFSKKGTDVNDELSEVLKNHFFSAFKQPEFYQFHHESDLELNETYVFVSKIFENPDEIYEQSRNLAMHLYRQTVHPKIKAGEFYTVYFQGCMIDGETVDAVGLFKSENKDSFIKVYEKNDVFQIDLDQGINLSKPDKGCLIFNLEKENGYLVTVVDNTSKGAEAMYWTDDFLFVKHREDDYFQTKNVMTLCKSFVTKKLPDQFEISKAEQADLLNKSLDFFKKNESFEMEMFASEVMQNQKIIDSFMGFKEDFESERNIQLSDNFDISENAVKKQTRAFKSIIKLDKNFHIYVHGKREYIEKGFDSTTGLHYYKLFFREEE
jgi:hypothetical protein